MTSALLIAVLLAAGPTLPSARAAYANAQSALQAAQARVAEQQAQLQQLSAQIAADKSKQPGQPLFVPGALEHELAQSQALSDELAKSRADQNALAARAEQARGGLYQALSDEITAQEAQPAKDQAALAELSKLQAERAKVAPKAVVAPPAPSFSHPTDDPTMLRERADALRDQADKLGKQQVALAARIQSARDQAQLEDQLRQLDGESSLFDESDRRVRVSRAADTAGTPASLGTGTQNGTGGGTATGGGGGARDTVSESYGAPASPDVNNPTGALGGSVPGAGVPQPDVAPGATPVGSVQIGELVRPDQLGRVGIEPLDDDASLPELLRAQQQLALERARLESQAKALDTQATGH